MMVRSGPPTGATERNNLAWLELKIPPVLLLFIFAVLMWLVTLLSPEISIPRPVRLLTSGMVAGAGAFIAFSGVMSFRRARTTVNPTTPDASSALVTSGIYRRTRNPMYLGLFLFLIAWGLFLSNPLSLLLPFVFVLYMNRFQIRPEEIALEATFGKGYVKYRREVPRWMWI